MDQITSILGSSGTVGILALVLLEVYKLYSKTKSEDQTKIIEDLKSEIQDLKQNHINNQIEIQNLRKEVYELIQENAELRGLLQAQENKEELVKKFVKKVKNNDK